MIRARWQQLQFREQAALLLGGGIIALVLIWTLAWEPLQQSIAAERARVVEQQSLLLWLQSIEPDVERLRQAQTAVVADRGRSPIGIIDQSARYAGLAGALQRIEPSSSQQVRVVFEQVEFAQMMNWLVDLTASQPFRVEQLDAQRGARSGRVDAIVLLQTGPG